MQGRSGGADATRNGKKQQWKLDDLPDSPGFIYNLYNYIILYIYITLYNYYTILHMFIYI